MNNLATSLIADLHSWKAEQMPLVRALVEEKVDTVADIVRQMQVLNDEQVVLFETTHKRTLEDVAEMKHEHKLANKALRDRIDQLERRLFGQSSERKKKVPDPRRKARKRHRDTMTEEEKEAKRAQIAAARQAKLDKLRTEILVLPLPENEGESRPLPPLESVLYEWRRGELVRIVVKREQKVEDGKILTAPPPPQVVEGGKYGPALHAKVAMDKCLMALPLHRQSRAFERMNAPLAVSVLCSLYHRCADAVEPIYKAMIKTIRESEHVSADETPQPVLDEKKVRKAWMWVFATDDVLLYTYSASRGGKVAEGILGHSTGTLTVDGYTGYNLVTGEGLRERGGCWSHARRGLYEAQDYDQPLIEQLLDDIGELFYIEHLAIEDGIVGTTAHQTIRTERSAPIVKKILDSVEAHKDDFDSRSSIARAMNYLSNQQTSLSLFLTRPMVPIHNNLSERALRVMALLRKNALFVGHDEAGKSLAMLMTMAATCQLHGVDPERWLEDVLIRVGEPKSTVEELLPWVWKTGRGSTAKSVLLSK